MITKGTKMRKLILLTLCFFAACSSQVKIDQAKFVDLYRAAGAVSSYNGGTSQYIPKEAIAKLASEAALADMHAKAGDEKIMVGMFESAATSLRYGDTATGMDELNEACKWYKDGKVSGSNVVSK